MGWTGRLAAAVVVGGVAMVMAGMGRPPGPGPTPGPVPTPVDVPPPPGPVGAPPMRGERGAPERPVRAGAPVEAVVAATRAGLRDVAFMEGRWRGVTEGSVVEEHWSAPEGRCMMGMFRWVAPGGEPHMFQLMTMTEEGGGVAMRLREFSPELVAKEEKDKPKVLRLVEAAGERAAFAPEGEGAEGVERVVYERTDPGTLVFTVQFKEGMNRAPFRLELRREEEAEAAGPRERGAE